MFKKFAVAVSVWALLASQAQAYVWITLLAPVGSWTAPYPTFNQFSTVGFSGRVGKTSPDDTSPSFVSAGFYDDVNVVFKSYGTQNNIGPINPGPYGTSGVPWAVNVIANTSGVWELKAVAWNTNVYSWVAEASTGYGQVVAAPPGP